ncbi:peptidylprolyl isomerase [Croceibacterium xixiisoli]|nr:peptidylprolyl isomerase [Croceibacterium xixiisoli]
MITRLFASALALSLVVPPIHAIAQDQAEDERPAADQPTAAEGAAPNPAAPRQYPLTVNMDQTQDRENILFLDLSNGKRVAIRLMPEWAPAHIERIKTLTRQGFYDGIIFHRVIDGFMAQTGDPTGTGRSGSDLPDLTAEFNPLPHVRGTVSMARAADENSANSQFFIVFYPRFSLDRRYTNFGRVIAGMDAVDEIHRGEPPSDPSYIVQASIAADNKPQKMPSAAPAPAHASEAQDLFLPSNVSPAPSRPAPASPAARTTN